VGAARARRRRRLGPGGGTTTCGEISERDDLTLRALAITERTTVAEQRRQAVRSYCAQARQDPDVAEIFRLMLASRRSRSGRPGNVISLRIRRGDSR
jgi:hypothetical protein